MGDNNFYKSIVENTSIGYSYNKIIYNDSGVYNYILPSL